VVYPIEKRNSLTMALKLYILEIATVSNAGKNNRVSRFFL